MSKILSACVAEKLTWIVTKHNLLPCNGLVFFFLSNQQLDHILLYVASYLHILSYGSLDLCLVLCTLPPLMSVV